MKIILIGLTAIVAIFLIFATTRPANFRVERSATLSASPAALFEHVNNHHGTSGPHLVIRDSVSSKGTGQRVCLLRFSYLQNAKCCGSAPLRLCVESAVSV